MFANQTHYFKDGLDQTYAFTTSPVNGASHRQGIYPCKAYARQTLRGIADNHFGADPFRYKLADLWLDVFQKPWAVPRSLDKIIDDLAVKIANHELFVYLEDSPLWHADFGVGVGGGDGGKTSP